MSFTADETFDTGELNGEIDASALLSDIDVDEEEIAWRKGFIGFDEEDERRLAALEPLLRDRKDEIADRFYDNLTSHDGTLEIIGRSPKGIDALKRTQSAYLVSLATGAYDEDYFRNRARIGKLHEILDMPMKQYIGQYGVYYDLILSAVEDRVQRQTVDAIETWIDEDGRDGETGFVGKLLGSDGPDTDTDDGLDASLEEAVESSIHDGMADVLAVLRIINLDMQVAADTYFESYSQELDRTVQQRDDLARTVERDVEGPIEDLDAASASVAESAQAINDLAASQATDVETVADETESLHASIEEIAATAETVAEQSQTAESLAERGTDRADVALEELATVQAVTADLAAAAEQLERRTEAIDDVLERIGDLTERTKILGTNASVEAGRNDDPQGTLEVIADEVQTFADQARADLDAIEDEVEGIGTVADETVETVDETTDRVAESVDRVDAAIRDFDAVHDAIEETADGIDDVATATSEQAHSADVIRRTVEQSARKASRISTETESVAAATEEQTAKLSELSDAIGQLGTADSVDRRAVYER